MRPSVRTITFSGVLTSLTFVLMMTGYFTQLGEFFWYISAMLVMIFAVASYPLVQVYTYACSAILLLIFTSFNIVYLLPYLLFFGPYPILSRFIQRLQSPIKYLIKWLYFTVALFVMIIFSNLFLNIDVFDPIIALETLLFGTAAFVGFELIYTHAQKTITALSSKLKVG